MAWHSGNGALTTSQMNDNAKEIWKIFYGLGWSKQSVSAMLGNMRAESTINPQREEVGGGGGYGLVQWTPKSKLVNYCNSNGLKYNSGSDQCKVIENERKNNTPNSWIDVGFGMSFTDFSKSTKSPTYLADVFIKCYERPANNNQPIRGQWAEEYFKMLPDNPTGGNGECVKVLEVFSHKHLVISQGADDDFSHKGHWAYDVDPTTKTLTLNVDVKVVAHINYGGGNQHFFTSVDKVYFANGKVDYLSFYVDHSNDNLSVGTIKKAGENILNYGTAGGVAPHWHIMAGQGVVDLNKLNDWQGNEQGAYEPLCMNRQNWEELFFKRSDSNISFVLNAKQFKLKTNDDNEYCDGKVPPPETNSKDWWIPIHFSGTMKII